MHIRSAELSTSSLPLGRSAQYFVAFAPQKKSPHEARIWAKMGSMKRIVVKIGTKVLSKKDGSLDAAFLADLVAQIVVLRKKKIQVIVVTSGAVGAGRSALVPRGIRSETVRRQLFAAVGQVKLMSMYARLFEKYGYHCAQVLATKEDFRDDEHYLNMKNCFEGLLLDNVVPIVNENDVVATTELMFTDNDELAGLVATQLAADRLIILTSTDGVLDTMGNTVAEVDATKTGSVAAYISSRKSGAGRGGMSSKFNVAKALAQKGMEVNIVNGRRKNVLSETLLRAPGGTRFVPAIRK